MRNTKHGMVRLIIALCRSMTINLEFAFDTTGVEPFPWWRPFFWLKVFKENREEFSNPGFVLRCGVFGFHFCIAAHAYE